MTAKLENNIAAIKAGNRSLNAARKDMGEELTPEIDAILKAAADGELQAVSDHQDRMQRAQARGY